MHKDWTQDATDEITAITTQRGRYYSSEEIATIIVKHCPFKPGVVYVPMIDVEPGHVRDWATVAASYIHGETLKNVSRTAAVIATFAKPLMDLLAEAKREHADGEDMVCATDRIYEGTPEAGACTCGADAWNAKVDAVLKGVSTPCEHQRQVQCGYPRHGEVTCAKCGIVLEEGER